MIIRNMFADDINRKINGVIKVDQAADDVIEQELNEYVITKELKKHFITFFNYYSDSFDQPTADMGVWISGFFGSGKSHFLKMLSYLLENKEVNGVRSVECFRKKFADDSATFMMIDRATKCKTETILFNIDIEGSINKDKTAVLRVFAKMFYNHLGFYGENLKVAMLEYYIDQQGKTEEFRRIFEEKKGKSWTEQRRAFAFNGKFIIPKYDTKPVTVNLLSANRKISNMIFSLNFYQKEAVADNREVTTYLVYFTDANGKQISNVQKIIADKTSDNGSERTFRCNFSLKSLKYNKTDSYYLVIADEQGLQMPQREEFQIDIAFAVDEFDFFS